MQEDFVIMVEDARVELKAIERLIAEQRTEVELALSWIQIGKRTVSIQHLQRL